MPYSLGTLYGEWSSVSRWSLIRIPVSLLELSSLIQTISTITKFQGRVHSCSLNTDPLHQLLHEILQPYWKTKLSKELQEMDHDEADFGENFFGEEDEAPVDMEVVREGMKLVPLSDMCFGDPNDVMDVVRENIMNPLALMLTDPINFQGSTKHDIATEGVDYPRTNCLGDGSGKSVKHANELGMEVAGGVPITETNMAAEISANVVTGGGVVEAGPRPDFSSWTVEDDLMLKNAMEAGAAVEALAKGAVKFSQRYTVWELRERWRALLYDPDVSEQAAMRMLKCEASARNPGKLSCLNRVNDPQEILKKRKLNSVRTHYYKMRKRIAAEKLSGDLVSNLDVESVDFIQSKMATDSFIQDSSSKSFVAPSDLCTVGPAEAVDKELESQIDESTISQVVSLLGVGGVGAVVQALPSIATDESIQGDSSLIGQLPQEDAQSQTVQATTGLEILGQEHNVPLESVQKPDTCSGGLNMGPEMVSSTSNVAIMSVAQSNLAFMDPGKASEDFVMGVSTQHDKHPDEVLDLGANHVPPDATLVIPKISTFAIGSQSEIIVDSSGKTEDKVVNASELSDSDSRSGDENETSVDDDLASRDKPLMPETGHMICVLNTEDTDIPSPPPGSVMLSPSLFSLTYSPTGMEGEENESSMSAGGYERNDNFEISAHDFMLQVSEDKDNLVPVGKMELTPDSRNSCGKCTVDNEVLATALDSGLPDAFVKKNDKEAMVALGNTGNSIDRSGGILLTSQGVLNGNPEGLCSVTDHQSNLHSDIPAISENEIPHSQAAVFGYSEQGLYCADHTTDALTTTHSTATLQGTYEECFESEEEMPSFSDVEAMILDLDLDPAFDEDVSAVAESRRLYKRHRKTLMRLEQGAHAALERALNVRGAIAVLYGHHLRYFIMRNEVLLGRMTQDNFVDIDLGKEGRANKVSRKQANIKLKEDGVFYLKNLGRRALAVNNISVANGQHASLGSNFLIEVGGMKFVFEINKKLVRQRVAEMLSRQHC